MSLVFLLSQAEHYRLVKGDQQKGDTFQALRYICCALSNIAYMSIRALALLMELFFY